MPSPTQRGLSIIESMCALAVLAIVTGAAVPRFQGLRDSRAMAGVASQLETDIQLARSESVLLGRTVRLTLGDAGQGSCYMVHTGEADACRCGDAQAPQCEADAELLRAVRIAPQERVQLRAAVDSILFDADRGTTTPTATLRVVAADGRALHQIVNITGRVRTCSPGGAVAGFKAC